MRKWMNIKGETLTETIIALSILAITISIASTVVVNTMRNMSVAKQRVIAVNIAREGIEAMRSVRDTNWLLYSDRRRQCWNNDPGAPSCDGSTPIEPGVYVIYKENTSERWKLAFADPDRFNDVTEADGGDADIITDNDVDLSLAQLSLVDIDLDTDSDNADIDNDDDTGFDDDTDMYNHKDANLLNSYDATLADTYGTLVRQTPYTRYIFVEYLENVPDDLSAPNSLDAPPESISSQREWTDAANDPVTLNRMRLTSVVQWINRGVTHSVELTTIITDHLGREELSS